MPKRISRSGENKTITPADLLSITITTETGCMEWQRCRTSDGYGTITYKSVAYRTHRLMAMLVYGEPRPNDNALHSCDNPPCINPDHLRWGTHQENMAEKKAKNRSTKSRGIDRYNAVLTEDIVRWIRKMSAEGASVKQMADYLGCSSGAVSGVKFNRAWTHVK